MRVYRRTLLDGLIVFCLVLATFAILRCLHFKMETAGPWMSMQVLDRELLLHEPLRTLWYLHCEPPGFNAFLAGVAAISTRCHVGDETVALAAYFVLAVAATWALFQTVLLTTGSRRLAFTLVLGSLASPGFHYFSHLCCYTFIEYCTIALLLLWTLFFLKNGRPVWLALVVATVLALVWTRSLFHPVWGISYVLLTLACRAWLGWPGQLLTRRHVSTAAACLLIGLAAWPLKNYYLFGHATYSTFVGYNLARDTPLQDHHPDLQLFVTEGRCSANVERDAEAFRARFGRVPPVLTAVDKSQGGRNFNNLVLVRAHEELSRQALDWRLHHIDRWLDTVKRNYLAWNRATFLWPYTQERDFDDPRYQAYANAVNATLFHDFWPLLEQVAPGWGYRVWDRPLSYTLFALVVFPLICLSAVVLFLLRVRERRLQECGLLIAFFGMVFPMLCACLTDGIEGNRMRFATVPCLLVVCAYLMNELAALVKRLRNRRSQAPTGPASHEPGAVSVITAAA